MKKIISILRFLSVLILITLAPLGVIYTLLPNLATVIPDAIFYPLFYAQFPVIALFIITSVLKDKFNQ